MHPRRSLALCRSHPRAPRYMETKEEALFYEKEIMASYMFLWNRDPYCGSGRGPDGRVHSCNYVKLWSKLKELKSRNALLSEGTTSLVPVPAALGSGPPVPVAARGLLLPPPGPVRLHPWWDILPISTRPDPEPVRRPRLPLDLRFRVHLQHMLCGIAGSMMQLVC